MGDAGADAGANVDASATEEVGTPDALLVPSYSFTSSETTMTTTSSTMTETESMTSSRERRKLRRESKKSITVSSSASPPCDRADIDIDPTSCYAIPPATPTTSTIPVRSSSRIISSEESSITSEISTEVISRDSTQTL